MIEMRPRDIAVFLLASGETLPRKRARDQQADIAGLELKRRVLTLLVAIDPEPEELEPALLQIVEEIGPPYGPTRAICAIVRDDWEAAASTPEFRDWLMDEALHESQRESRRPTNDERRPSTVAEPRTENREPGHE
jgi:hypothetical protein